MGLILYRLERKCGVRIIPRSSFDAAMRRLGVLKSKVFELGFKLLSGKAAINKKREDIWVLFQIEHLNLPEPDYEPEYVTIGVHGSIVLFSHNKSSGDKSIEVVEGEAAGVL
jgi:hypothetical protein